MSNTRENSPKKIPHESQKRPEAVHDKLNREQPANPEQAQNLVRNLEERGAKAKKELMTEIVNVRTDKLLDEKGRKKVDDLNKKAGRLFDRFKGHLGRIRDLIAGKDNDNSSPVAINEGFPITPSEKPLITATPSGPEQTVPTIERRKDIIPPNLTIEQLNNLLKHVENDRLLSEAEYDKNPSAENRAALNRDLNYKIDVMARIEDLRNNPTEEKNGPPLDEQLQTILVPTEAKLNYDLIGDNILNQDPLLLFGKYFQNLNFRQDSLKQNKNDKGRDDKRAFILKLMTEAGSALEALKSGDPELALQLVQNKFFYVSGKWDGEGKGIELNQVINSIKEKTYPKIERRLRDEIQAAMSNFNTRAIKAAKELKDFFPQGINLDSDLSSSLRVIDQKIKELDTVLKEDLKKGKLDRKDNFSEAINNLKQKQQEIADLLLLQTTVKTEAARKERHLQDLKPKSTRIPTSLEAGQETLAELVIKRDIANLKKSLNSENSSLEAKLAFSNIRNIEPEDLKTYILGLSQDEIISKQAEARREYNAEKNKKPKDTSDVGKKRLRKLERNHFFWQDITEIKDVIILIKTEEEKLIRYEAELKKIQNSTTRNKAADMAA